VRLFFAIALLFVSVLAGMFGIAAYREAMLAWGAGDGMGPPATVLGLIFWVLPAGLVAVFGFVGGILLLTTRRARSDAD